MNGAETMKDKILWLRVTQDKYELPIAVADSSYEMSLMFGDTPRAIVEKASQYRRYNKMTPYRSVRISREEWENGIN